MQLCSFRMCRLILMATALASIAHFAEQRKSHFPLGCIPPGKSEVMEFTGYHNGPIIPKPCCISRSPSLRPLIMQLKGKREYRELYCDDDDSCVSSEKDRGKMYFFKGVEAKCCDFDASDEKRQVFMTCVGSPVCHRLPIGTQCGSMACQCHKK